MQGKLTTPEVLALASDLASRQAGRGLAAPHRWTGLGSDASLLWGFCQGSGQQPYRTMIDADSPAYACSCPSRKSPCKHAVGLMLLWSADQVPAGAELPEFVTSWQQQRRSGADRGPVQRRPRTVEDLNRLTDRRAENVRAGLAELDRWLSDQVRTGLAGTERDAFRRFDAIAARMIDAQAPGVAGRLRGLAWIPSSGDGWPGRLLEQYAMLRLLITAHDRIDQLPDDLAATVRSHIGYQIPKELVLAEPPIHDHWQVLGRRDSVDGQLSTRRVWLRGRQHKRFALALFFAHGGIPLDDSLLPGTSVEADLHFYPGRGQHRALIGSRAEVAPSLEPADLLPQTIAELYEVWGSAVADDPWLTIMPALVRAVPQPPAGTTTASGWGLLDDGGLRVTLDEGGLDPWQLAAVSGGRPVIISGEWSLDTDRAARLLPLAAWPGDGVAVR